MNNHYRRCLSLFILATWMACTITPSPRSKTTQDTETNTPSPTSGVRFDVGDEVEYVGVFDWEEAIYKDGRYYFSNNLGYRFRVDSLHVATSSVQLRPCLLDENKTASSVKFQWGIPVVFADHVVEDDPSIAIVNHMEDAFTTDVQLLATGTVDATTYCQAFVRATNLKDTPFGQSTLVFSGAYTLSPKGDNERWVTIEAQTNLSEGLLNDFTIEQHATWIPTSNNIKAQIRFTRYPTRAFDDIAPQMLQPIEIAWEVLGNLMHQADVSVITQPK